MSMISTNVGGDFGSSIAGVLPQSSTPPIVVGALLYYAELNAVVPAFYSNSPIMNPTNNNAGPNNSSGDQSQSAPKLLVPVGLGGHLDVASNSQSVTINVDSNNKDVTYAVEGENESKQCLLWKLDLQSTDNQSTNCKTEKLQRSVYVEESEVPRETNENVRVTRSAAKRIKYGGNATTVVDSKPSGQSSITESRIVSADADGNNQTQCPLCDKVCSKGYMKNHMRLVHRSPTMQCNTCQKVFKNKYTLAKHVKRHDGQDVAVEKPFACEMCERRYQFQCQLKHHVKLHAGERPFKCEICNKDFPHKGSLKAHKSSMHAGHKFQCELCGKCFTTSVYLRLHRQRVHEGTRPLLKCDLCGEEFKHKGTFRKHKLKHAGIRPYRCDVCGKKFLTSTVLKSHSYIHTGELPFPCETCGRKFRQKVSLRNHQFTHLGYKPYQCVLCTRQFLCPALLKQHKCSAKRMRSGDGGVDAAVTPVVGGDLVGGDARATCLEVV